MIGEPGIVENFLNGCAKALLANLTRAQLDCVTVVDGFQHVQILVVAERQSNDGHAVINSLLGAE